MASDRSERIRKVYVMTFKEGKEEAYKFAHDAIWPEVTAMLLAAGAHNYSISLLPSTRQLFAYVEVINTEGSFLVVPFHFIAYYM
jgi:L-rhamnose mutarotase